jgi:glutamine amidotransferase
LNSICSNTSTHALFAHIRAATATAITPTNNHPFVFGRHTIMHNGYIADFTKIARQMSNLMTQECFENISGGTDTEHFAALYMSYLTFGEGKEGWEKVYETDKMLEV